MSILQAEVFRRQAEAMGWPVHDCEECLTFSHEESNGYSFARLLAHFSKDHVERFNEWQTAMPRPFEDLSETGLLWLINRVALHPRGFSLAVHYNAEGKAEGWSLIGDGNETWKFADEVDDDKFAAVEGLLAARRRAGSGADPRSRSDMADQGGSAPTGS